MRSLNAFSPLNDPAVVYLRVQLATRLRRLRAEAAGSDRSRGASAIEWAIITGILAAIAIAVGAVIKSKVSSAANSISTGDG
jgi:Flp pilus assembly pilin Flp